MMTNPPPIYNPDIPLKKQSLADSQIDFLNNFSTLYNAFSVNHIPLDAATSAGNHTNIQLLEQATSNQLQTDTGEISVYCKNVAGQTDQIFLRYQGNQKEFQFSTYQIYALNPTNKGSGFFTFLPGNVILYFGLAILAVGGATSNVINLLPNIAKNIITINFCPVGSRPTLNPFVELQVPNPVTKVISALFLKPNPGLTALPPQLYYMVLANI
jgi:hypothetical protein